MRYHGKLLGNPWIKLGWELAGMGRADTEIRTGFADLDAWIRDGKRKRLIWESKRNGRARGR